MSDLAIDNDMDVYIDGSGDLAFTTGRDAFEQELLVRLTAYYEQLISETDPETVLEGLKVGARRTVAAMDRLDEVHLIDAEFDEDDQTKVLVTLVLDSGERLEFDV